jgi:oxygen-dependent protoporphyrinogen oxidase
LGDKCQVSHSLQKLEPHQGGWLTTFRLGSTGQSKTYFSRSVLLTTPAFTTAKLLGSHASPPPAKGLEHMALLPRAAQELSAIEYPPIIGVYLAYPDRALRKPLEGFGHLIPRANKIRSLGSIWCSTLFPGRAPKGYSLLLTFIGGAQDRTAADLSREDLVRQVDSDLRRMMVLKEDAPPPRVISVKTWEKGIPQYNKGYSKVLEEVRNGAKNTPGLFLGGNYISGVSVGDCINYGATISNNISSYLLKTRFS